MPSLLPAHAIRRNAPLQDLRVVMSYDERILRRKRLVTETGADFMVDLGEVTSLDQGDAFVLDDGRLVSVIAADEPVVMIRGNLPRLAWMLLAQEPRLLLGVTLSGTKAALPRETLRQGLVI